MLSRTALKAASAVALTASALALGAASAAPAFAATTATYGTWSEVTEVTAYENYTGSVSFGASGISGATYVTTFSDNNSYNEDFLDVNDDEWLSAETPFGAVFGASGPSDTANFLRTEINVGPQTTVYTFETPVPANRLGIAVGDLDYDTVVFTAVDNAGNPLTGDELTGASSDNAFNLCAVTDSVPTTCSGSDVDIPPFTPGANDVTFGPNADSGDGVTGWIFPSAEIKTLTITHSGDDSSIRTWMAAIDVAAVEPALANTASPETGVTLSVALTLGLLGIGGLFVAHRRTVNA